MFKLIEGQTVTIRQSIEIYGTRGESDPDYFYTIDGPVTVKIIDICEAPDAEWGTHYNVDIEVDHSNPFHGGDLTNIDIEEDDIVA